ncbi:phasin family protein [Novosphingobium sp. G106]|uniref:phasin family protein n=1 Tax=Novosphingobium sp. G106 TaxID=2849500 RepID=UPI001C2DB646|nr:phasin family protein [Novosphingobium sp. G106]MBV1687811.1 phasin family protein [Novosphingobium sp. G106]
MTERSEMNFNSAKSLDEVAPASDALVQEGVAAAGSPEPVSEKVAGKDVSPVPGATAEKAPSGASTDVSTAKAQAVARKSAAAASVKLPRQKAGTAKSPAPRTAQKKVKSGVAEVPAKTAKPSPLSRTKTLAKSRATKAKPAAATAPAHRLGDIIDPPAQPAAKKKVTTKVEKAVEGTFEKTVGSLGQVAALTKGNAAAIAQSGKILGGGLAELATGCVADGRAAFGILKADAKELSALRSPAGLLAFNTQILTRNVRELLKFSSKNREAIVKVAKDSAAPVAARFTQVAATLRPAK